MGALEIVKTGPGDQHHIAILLPTAGVGLPRVGGDLRFLKERMEDKMNNKAPSGWLLLVTLTSD